MGDVPFRRCKDILCHDQYIYTCFVHLYGPASPELEKKSRGFCGRDDFFFALHCFLVKNRTSGRPTKETSEKGRQGKKVKNH